MTKPRPFETCRHCGRRFLKPIKRAVFCSAYCAIYSKVAIRGANECWPWTGGLKENGYGSFSYNGKAGQYPHRVALQIKLDRALAPTEDTRHKCDNRRCCNPRHLIPGSRGDNMKDCRDRSRFKPPPLVCGERSHLAKLTEHDVREARALRRAGQKVADIASRYGVSISGMEKALRRETWRHI